MPDSMPALENECFFIGPIGEDGSEIRRRSDGVLNFIVARAAVELGLTAIRADQIAAPGQITLQVIDHVLQAKAAVADLTGRNPNVFYELAVRHSARLPVALIVAHDDPPLPFDIAQMRVIRFDHHDLASADQCQQGIVAHLREALEGAVDSPIGASIDLRALGGGDRVERSIAEVLTGIEELSRLQRMALSRTTRAEDSLARQLDMERRRRSGLEARFADIGTSIPPLLERLASPDDVRRGSALEALHAIAARLVDRETAETDASTRLPFVEDSTKGTASDLRRAEEAYEYAQRDVERATEVLAKAAQRVRQREVDRAAAEHHAARQREIDTATAEHAARQREAESAAAKRETRRRSRQRNDKTRAESETAKPDSSATDAQ